MLDATLNLQTTIHNFAPGEDVRHALLLTYTFDGLFLEDAEDGLLETLWQRNCENVLVIRDGKAVLSEKRSHRYSVVNAAYSNRTFHPKLMLLLAESEALAVIGSANLTRGGLEDNLELGATYHLTRTQGPIEFFRALRDYLANHLRPELGAVPPQVRGRGALELLVDDFGLFLEDASSALSPTDVRLWFLHNYAEPLLPQIVELLPSRNLDALWVVSPFYESDPGENQPASDSPSAGGAALPGTGTRCRARLADDPPGQPLDRTLVSEVFRTFELADSVQVPPMRIHFQSSATNVTQLPVNVLKPHKSHIGLYAKDHAADDPRRLHAKMLVCIGRDDAERPAITIVHGSANFTRAALLTTPPSGNAEIVVVTRLPPEAGNAVKLGDYLNLGDLFTRIDNWDALSYHPPRIAPPPRPAIHVWGGLVFLADRKVTVSFRVDQPDVRRLAATLRGEGHDLPLGEILSPFPEPGVHDFTLPEGAIVEENALSGLRQLPYQSVCIEAFDETGQSLGSSEGPLNVDCPQAFVGPWLPDDVGLDNQIYLAGLGNAATYDAQRLMVERMLSPPPDDKSPAPSHYADLDLFFRRLHIGFRGLRRRLEQSHASRYLFGDTLRQLADWAQTAVGGGRQEDYSTARKIYLCGCIVQTARECVEVMREAQVALDEIATIAGKEFLIPARPIVDFAKALGSEPDLGMAAGDLLADWDGLRQSLRSQKANDRTR